MSPIFAASLAMLFLPGILALPQGQRRSANPAFSAIIVFGDSFSDNGNGSYRISNGTWPANPAYYDGRFSNGPTWAEYVAGNLSIPLYDYAVGGATTSNDLVQGFTGPGSTITVPSVSDQVASFLEKTTPQGTAFSDSDVAAVASPLFVILAGLNDVFFNPNISATQSYQALAEAKAKLSSANAEANFLTLAPPDASQLPYGFYADALTKQQIRVFTNALAELLIDSDQDSTVNVDLRPLFTAFDYYAEPLQYGFGPLGKYGSCLVGAYEETPNVTLCDDVQTHVYWDEYHPTTNAHSWIARKALDAISGPFSKDY